MRGRIESFGNVLKHFTQVVGALTVKAPSGSEQTRLIRKVWLKAIADFMCLGDRKRTRITDACLVECGNDNGVLTQIESR